MPGYKWGKLGIITNLYVAGTVELGHVLYSLFFLCHLQPLDASAEGAI